MTAGRLWDRKPGLAAATGEPVTSPSPPKPASSGSKPPPAGGPQLVLGDRRIPVVLPSRRDPRLKLSAVIIALQVLGQTVLDFKVSIAQILVTIGVCAVIDTAVTLKQQGILAWPASALLTGNSIAFIRAPRAQSMATGGASTGSSSSCSLRSSRCS